MGLGRYLRYGGGVACRRNAVSVGTPSREHHSTPTDLGARKRNADPARLATPEAAAGRCAKDCAPVQGPP